MISRIVIQAFIWRCCLTKMENIPHPQGYGWKLNNGNELRIDWNEENAAPDAVLELISCSYKNTCSHSTVDEGFDLEKISNKLKFGQITQNNV